MMSMIRAAGCLAVFVALLTPAFSQTSERPRRYTILDIHLGDTASSIPDQFVNYACGTNGGPPSLPLQSFAGFMKCKPDSNGLHEVYFEYDDELEYEARALEDRARIRMYAGTTLYEFPIVASLLFDDAGHVRGMRIVTDPRQQASRDRAEFWELANFLRQKYADDSWKCRNLPPDEGESPIGDRFVKTRCEKSMPGMQLILEQRLLQKKGQRFVDPQSGKPQPQAFDSETRFEMYDAAVQLR